MKHIDDTGTRQANLKFIRTSMKEELLAVEDEQNLAKAWRDNADTRALHKLIRSHMRLVVSFAMRFRSFGLPLGDLIQEGNMGLMQAASRFDPQRKVRFSTYAGWWIRASIQDYILRNWSIVRTGTTSGHKALFFNLRRVRANLGETEQGYLTDEGKQTICKELKVTSRDVTLMEQRIHSQDQSLNANISEQAKGQWQDLLIDPKPNPENEVIHNSDQKRIQRWLKLSMKTLSDREREIIKRRRLKFKPDTLEAIGNDLNVSKERIRQLEVRALKVMAEKLVNYVDDIKDLPGIWKSKKIQ